MFLRSATASPFRIAFGLTRIFRASVQLHKSRQRLAQLEPHILRDIGLTPDQARAEAIRPLWDAPDQWIQRD